jgi:hypothetical protein
MAQSLGGQSAGPDVLQAIRAQPHGKLRRLLHKRGELAQRSGTSSTSEQTAEQPREVARQLFNNSSEIVPGNMQFCSNVRCITTVINRGHDISPLPRRIRGSFGTSGFDAFWRRRASIPLATPVRECGQ